MTRWLFFSIIQLAKYSAGCSAEYSAEEALVFTAFLNYGHL